MQPITKKRVSLTLGLFAVAITSCTKKSENVATYQSANSATTDPVVMYVYKKQIHDTSIINTFLRANDVIDNYSNSRIQTINENHINITFINGDSVKYTFGGIPVPTTHIGKKIKYSNSIFIIQDTKPVLTSIVTREQYYDRPFKIVYKIPDSSYNVPSPMMNEIYEYSFPRIPFQTADDKLYLKDMMLTLSTWKDDGRRHYHFFSSGLRANIPADHIEDNLSARDTIVIQTRSILLNRKL